MERPRIKIRLTALDYMLEITALLSVLAIIVLYIIYRIKAPEIVPIHYNIRGEVDGYGSADTLIMLPILSILTYVGMTILNKYPHIFNFPTVVTEQNALRLYKIATRTVRWLKLLVCLLYADSVWSEIKIITNQTSKLGGITWILIACIAIYPIFPIVKMIKSK
jgi:hypothetical protein